MTLVITVLKVALICLLALVILIAAVLCYVLFAPVSYNISLSSDEALDIGARIRDFLGIAIFDVGYVSKEGISWKLRLFHLKKPILPKDDAGRGGGAESEDISEDDSGDVEAVIRGDEIADGADEAVIRDKDESAEPKTSKGETADIAAEKIKKPKVKKPKKKAKKKEDEDKEKKDYIAIAKDPATKRAVSFLFTLAADIIKRLLPKKFEADITFSTGEPDLTGKLTGGLALMPFSYGRKVSIIPDFAAEDPYLYGTMKLSGRIALFHILIPVIKAVLNKDVRKLYKSINK